MSRPESGQRNSGAGGRVLLVLPWDLRPIGGVDGVVAALYEQFAAHGRWEPILLVHSWGDRTPVFSAAEQYRKIRVRVRGPIEGKVLVRALASYLVCLPRELWKVASLVRTFRVAVVNAHYPTLGMVNVALARRLGLADSKLVLSFHGTDIRNAVAGNAVRRALWRWLLREADAVVAVSRGLAQLVADFEPRVRSRLEVVHNGLDADRFVADADGVDAGFPDLAGQRVVLSVGALDWNKGHDVLLTAFAELSAEHPDLHLVLVGQTGPHTGEIEDLVGRLGLDGRCTLVKDAQRAVVARWVSLASVFVLASRTEGFGLVLLEAGAFGVPVVATRVGGIPEVIPGPEYGVLVDPGDPAALAAAVRGVLDNPLAARGMGERLKERVRTVFSWERAYEKYAYLFAGRNVAGARK